MLEKTLCDKIGTTNQILRIVGTAHNYSPDFSRDEKDGLTSAQKQNNLKLCIVVLVAALGNDAISELYCDCILYFVAVAFPLGHLLMVFLILLPKKVIIILHYYCSDSTCGGRNYILKWVFLFRQFWPIDIFIVEKCECYH